MTICQPYAELIVRGEKRVENRKWMTKHRGTLLIHAGKSTSWIVLNKTKDRELVGGITVSVLDFGAIVGVADLVDCVHLSDPRIRSAELSWILTHKHATGPWCWVIDNVRRIKPIPYRGKQGLFDIPDSVVESALQGGAA